MLDLVLQHSAAIDQGQMRFVNRWEFMFAYAMLGYDLWLPILT